MVIAQGYPRVAAQQWQQGCAQGCYRAVAQLQKREKKKNYQKSIYYLSHTKRKTNKDGRKLLCSPKSWSPGLCAGLPRVVAQQRPFGRA